MKTATWNAAAPTLEAVQHTDSNTQELVDWLRANGSHVDVWGDQLWFTDDAGTQRCPLVGDWICLDPNARRSAWSMSTCCRRCTSADEARRAVRRLRRHHIRC